MRIYLDNCTFNRPFDVQNSQKVLLETAAVLWIEKYIRQGMYCLVWSYMLDYENALNPFEKRRTAINKWQMLADADIDESAGVLTTAADLVKLRIKTKDALHIACALQAECRFFITTDKKLLNKTVKNIQIINPVDFVKIHL